MKFSATPIIINLNYAKITLASEADSSVNVDKSSNIIFVALDDDGQPIGMTGLRFNDVAETKHKVFLWGMFVQPEERGKGIARQLIQTAVTYVEQQTDVELVQLITVASLETAIQLYESLGFETWGHEHHAHKCDEGYRDWVYMVKKVER